MSEYTDSLEFSPDDLKVPLSEERRQYHQQKVTKTISRTEKLMHRLGNLGFQVFEAESDDGLLDLSVFLNDFEKNHLGPTEKALDYLEGGDGLGKISVAFRQND